MVAYISTGGRVNGTTLATGGTDRIDSSGNIASASITNAGKLACTSKLILLNADPYSLTASDISSSFLALNISATIDAPCTISAIASGTDGQILRILNLAMYNVTVSASSTLVLGATSRVLTPSSSILELIYSSGTGKWFEVSFRS